MNAKQRRTFKKKFFNKLISELKENFTDEQVNTEMLSEMIRLERENAKLERENDELRQKLKMFPYDNGGW